MNVMKQTGKSLSELASEVPTYPQELVNIRVSDKNGVMEVPAIKEVIDAVEAEMAGNGRCSCTSKWYRTACSLSWLKPQQMNWFTTT